MQYHFDNKKEYKEIEILIKRGENTESKKLYPNDANMQPILDAIIKDCEESTYEEMEKEAFVNSEVMIIVNYMEHSDEENRSPSFESLIYVIDERFENTEKVLRENGI